MEQAQQTTPLVSIIMPTYNRAVYIFETIQSILAQTYPNWELLVIDDGSEDNTQVLIEAVADSRVKYFKFERTGITGKLKNFGIREAQGELISFMDSDDIWPALKIEKQVKALLAYPQTGFSFTNGNNFLEDKSIEAIFYKEQQGIDCKNVFIPYCQAKTGIFLQSVMVWKHAIPQAGMFEETRLFNDFTFIGNLTYYFDAVVLYDQLLFRRIHQGNSVNFDWISLSEEYFELLERYKKEKKLNTKVADSAIFIAYVNLGERCLAENQRSKAVHYFLKAYTHKPLSMVPLKKIIKAYLYPVKKN